jgi:hypothetical protein
VLRGGAIGNFRGEIRERHDARFDLLAVRQELIPSRGFGLLRDVLPVGVAPRSGAAAVLVLDQEVGRADFVGHDDWVRCAAQM